MLINYNPGCETTIKTDCHILTFGESLHFKNIITILTNNYNFNQLMNHMNSSNGSSQCNSFFKQIN